jgi:hypothetical protein
MSTSPGKFAVPARFAALIACAFFLAIYAATACNASLGKCATYDEPLHFVSAWIETHYHDFRIDPENPPFWKYYVAVGTDPSRLQLQMHGDFWDHTLISDLSMDNPFAKRTLYETPANDPDALIQSARARMVLLAAVLGLVICVWSWRLAGPVAALVATAAYCLDPNFMAHGPLVKNDVPSAFLFTLLMYCVWLTGRRAYIWRILAVALVLSALVNTKFSGLLGIPIVGLTLLIRALLPADWQILHWTARTRPHRLLAAAAIGLFAALFSYAVIWACYDFRFHPAPDTDQLSGLEQPITVYSFYQSSAQHGATAETPFTVTEQWVHDWKPDLTVRVTQWLYDHRLFPETYLRGFLYITGDTQFRATFLMGQIRMTGWWYYFPLLILFKTPLTTLIALFAAAGLWLIWRPNWISWSLISGAILPIIYFLLALRSNTNIGMRHILPVYPFLFIFLGVVAAGAAKRFPKTTIPILAVMLLTLATETFCAYPDFIPFFNVAAGGSRGGYQLLSDSNLDWGQDLKLLAAWRKDHPDDQLALCYFGSADPRYYGLHYFNLPASDAPDDQPARTDVPHLYAFSATLLQGLYMYPDQSKIYQQVYNHQPIAILGGSIYVYNEP